MSQSNGSFRGPKYSALKVDGEVGVTFAPQDMPNGFVTSFTVYEKISVPVPPHVEVLCRQVVAHIHGLLKTVAELPMTGTFVLMIRRGHVYISGSFTARTTEARWRIVEKMTRAIDIGTLIALLPFEVSAEVSVTAECKVQKA